MANKKVTVQTAVDDPEIAVGEKVEADDITFEWTYCCVCVNCPCGHQRVVDDDEGRTCECGRVYSLSWQVMVAKPNSVK